MRGLDGISAEALFVENVVMKIMICYTIYSRDNFLM